MRYVLLALLLAGCAGSQYYAAPPAPGVTRAFVCPGAEVFCGWVDMQPVGPSSQGDFTEPKRH